MRMVLVFGFAILAIVLAGLSAFFNTGCILANSPADTTGTGDYVPGAALGEDDADGVRDDDTTPAVEPGSDSDDTDTSDEPATDDSDDTSDSGSTQSGTLTAGSFDDNLNLDVFRDLLTELFQSDAGDAFPSVTLGQRILVNVKDQQGTPVGDARVVITATGTDTPAFVDQTTRSDGRVLFLTGLDGGSDAAGFTVAVYPPDGSDAVVTTPDPNSTDWEVTLTTTGALPTKLDLAFVVDTTGSMGDELEYLKTEVRSIAQAVNDLFPDVEQRYALILYRDEGDIYVVRPFDFTATLDDFVSNLEDQSADGGADWPEAMHLALEEAVKLSWATTGTARVLFHIADAPPHTEFGQRTFDAIEALRAKTIALYPVAASGVDTELEFYMRTAAFVTLSQYLFLTDDSGVGSSHAEPHIPCYDVQRLDQLMIRMIQTELAGARIEADAADIIRTVGNPVNGVCTAEESQ